MKMYICMSKKGILLIFSKKSSFLLSHVDTVNFYGFRKDFSNTHDAVKVPGYICPGSIMCQK